MEYNQNGNLMAIAGLAVVLLSKLNIIVTQNDLLAIVAGIVAFAGIIKQWRAHKSLAISAGAISPSVR